MYYTLQYISAKIIQKLWFKTRFLFKTTIYLHTFAVYIVKVMLTGWNYWGSIVEGKALIINYATWIIKVNGKQLTWYI